MELALLRQAVADGRIFWQRHALARMLERGISRQMVKTCILEGAVIEHYNEGKPLPSVLVLGFPSGAPLHVVAAYDVTEGTGYIITVYRPDYRHFEADFTTRRSS